MKPFVLFIVSTAFIFSCNNQPTGFTDEGIKAEAEKTLKEDTATDQLIVTVKEGIVTISGECLYPATKEQTTLRMETVPGVKAVINNSIVLSKQPLTDTELSNRLWEITKDYNTLIIHARDGVVDISGKLKRNDWDKIKAGMKELDIKSLDTMGLKIE